MANKISVDTTEIMALKSNLKTNIGGIIKNHKSKKQSVYSRMQQVMNEYRDCYEIYSQASAIIALLDEADAASKRIEPLYEQIISGLEYTISSTKQCERDIKKLLGIEKPEVSKIKDRNTRTVRSRGLSKDSDLIEEAIEEEGQEATIETWGKEELKEIEEETLLFGRKIIDATSQDLQINREALETVKAPQSLLEMSIQKESTHPKINLSSSGYADEIEKKRFDKISTYTSLLNQSVKEGKGEPQWLLDALAALGAFGGELLEKVADEIEARKKQEEERLKDIQNYADLLNEYRRTGRGEPQWLLDKLEELGAPYGVIDWQTVATTINGITIPSIQATQNLSSGSCEKYIKTLLEDLNGTIEDAWGISALNFEGDINDKEVYELAVMQYLEARDLDIAYELLGEQDESKRDQILLYWLLAEIKGKNLKEEPMPDWWLQESKKALENLEVLEEDFKNSKVAAFDYYFKYQYMVDIVQNDGTPIICDHFFEKWFEEQYGHLNPKSHDIKRLKYEMSQGLTIDLRNEEGLYDNEETEAFKNARNLWLNLKGVYEDFWDSKAIFTNNNKILQKIIDKLKKDDKLEAEVFQNPNYEQLIIEGEYRQAKDFITRLEKDGAQVVKNEDGTMTITLSTIIAEGVTIDDLQWGVVKLEDLPVKEYTITIDCFDYTGETYIDAKEFDKKYTEYQVQRFNDGSYLNDFTGMHNYSMYADEAMLRWGQIQDAYPDAEITFEQVMAMLRMEDERLALYKEQKTDSERIQDAGQGVIDLAAIAFAVTGHPYISVALEGGNAVASGTRENYDEMYLRIMGICLFGAGEYLKYADTGIELTEETIKANARKLSGLSSNEIKAATIQGDMVTVQLRDGTELICSRANLNADDLVKLNVGERLEKARSQYYDKLFEGALDDTAWEKLTKYAERSEINLNSMSWEEKSALLSQYKADIMSDEYALVYVKDKAEKMLKLSDIQLEQCMKNGYKATDYYSILNQDKNYRSVEVYLKSLEETQLTSNWKDMFYAPNSKVVVSYMPQEAYDNFVLGYGSIGRAGEKGGQFVIPQVIGDSVENKLAHLGSITEVTPPFKTQLAQELGLPLDTFKTGVVRVEIPLDGNINLHMVTGIEDGCNYQWIPGGKTLGGTTEGMIRQITKVDDPDLYNWIINNVRVKK